MSDPRCAEQLQKTNFQAIGTYDVHSVMHYGSRFCSKNKAEPALTLKDGALIPDDKRISEKDAAGIREYYASELQGSAGGDDGTDAGGGSGSDAGAGDKGNPFTGKTVFLEWQIASYTATYSVDVQAADGNRVAPCIDAGILRRTLSTTFSGSCPSAAGAGIGLPKAFRLCFAENDDWAHATCYAVPYKGETTLFLGADPD